ncbi:hypothetical protein KP509_38G064400 [Ceratopteris richardii]|uniref:Uncharacterized protein n=1 Tax=Ceratopteris richardii TaxID=49495 RepID=A0A8T2Q5D1_CERRI|nr:hypothetical protein KP509_38G064400 [Ceratopteris richardii]
MDPDYHDRVVERMQAKKSEGQRTLNSRLHDDQEFDLILISLTTDSPELPPSKAGPLSSEKLKRIRMLRSQNIVKKEPDLETKLADSHFSNFKVVDSTQVTDTEELEQAQFEARKRARIFLYEAEQPAIIAAQAIDASGTHGESLNSSLLEASEVTIWLDMLELDRGKHLRLCSLSWSH